MVRIPSTEVGSMLKQPNPCNFLFTSLRASETKISYFFLKKHQDTFFTHRKRKKHRDTPRNLVARTPGTTSSERFASDPPWHHRSFVGASSLRSQRRLVTEACLHRSVGTSARPSPAQRGRGWWATRLCGWVGWSNAP